MRAVLAVMLPRGLRALLSQDAEANKIALGRMRARRHSAKINDRPTGDGAGATVNARPRVHQQVRSPLATRLEVASSGVGGHWAEVGHSSNQPRKVAGTPGWTRAKRIKGVCRTRQAGTGRSCQRLVGSKVPNDFRASSAAMAKPRPSADPPENLAVLIPSTIPPSSTNRPPLFPTLITVLKEPVIRQQVRRGRPRKRR